MAIPYDEGATDPILSGAGRTYLTLRVSRDGGRTWGPREIHEPACGAAPFELTARFPPCACPRCDRTQ
ncbi:hypothetical protein SSPS47_14050 [Streptomyces sp. S4.7]|nr:hypothetical protein SSPS47_14050 [Streptomyces sp. S4.7]